MTPEMTPVKKSQSQGGRAVAASAATGRDLGTIVRIAVAGLAVIWLISQFTESPLDQAHGTSIQEYNDQQQWDEILDPIIGCPPGMDCHGLPDPSGF